MDGMSRAYTNIKIRKELGAVMDELVSRLEPYLVLYGLDNRSGLVQYLVVELAKKYDLVDTMDPYLLEVYRGLLEKG